MVFLITCHKKPSGPSCFLIYCGSSSPLILVCCRNKTSIKPGEKCLKLIPCEILQKKGFIKCFLNYFRCLKGVGDNVIFFFTINVHRSYRKRKLFFIFEVFTDSANRKDANHCRIRFSISLSVHSWSFLLPPPSSMNTARRNLFFFCVI